MVRVLYWVFVAAPTIGLLALALPPLLGDEQRRDRRARRLRLRHRGRARPRVRAAARLVPRSRRRGRDRSHLGRRLLLRRRVERLLASISGSASTPRTSSASACLRRRSGSSRLPTAPCSPPRPTGGAARPVRAHARDARAHRRADRVPPRAGRRARRDPERPAHTDALTSLPNRRGFERALEIELERSRRGDQPFSVLVADVDHFKAVNDRLGHLAGDDALRKIGATLAHGKRLIDTVARLGGEEFALIVPGTESGAATSSPSGCERVSGRRSSPNPCP